MGTYGTRVKSWESPRSHACAVRSQHSQDFSRPGAPAAAINLHTISPPPTDPLTPSRNARHATAQALRPVPQKLDLWAFRESGVPTNHLSPPDCQN
eukprot:2180807-Rhodomonas_salina.1